MFAKFSRKASFRTLAILTPRFWQIVLESLFPKNLPERKALHFACVFDVYEIFLKGKFSDLGYADAPFSAEFA